MAEIVPVIFVGAFNIRAPEKSATTIRVGDMGMAPRRGRDHALLVVADL
ncbi:MAG: hypothetical protein PVH37_07900 [Desulfobacterales bacterium]